MAGNVQTFQTMGLTIELLEKGMQVLACYDAETKHFQLLAT